jgi:AcrR family transcriptional regulator
MIVASADLLAEACRERLSVAEIVRRAGVSAREFHSAFTSVEDCLLAAFDEGLGRLTPQIARAVPAGASMLVKIEAGLGALLGFLDEEPGWGRVLLLELPVDAGPRRERALGALARVVSDMRFASLLDPDPPPTRDTAIRLASEVLDVIRSSMRTAGEEPLAALTPYLMDTLIEPELAWNDREHATHKRAPARPVVGNGILKPGRAARALSAIARNPGVSNRQIADSTGLGNESNTSQLLQRLQRQGLIRNTVGAGPGHANAWVLTADGETAIGARAGERERAGRAAA